MPSSERAASGGEPQERVDRRQGHPRVLVTQGLVQGADRLAPVVPPGHPQQLHRPAPGVRVRVLGEAGQMGQVGALGDDGFGPGPGQPDPASVG